jgi:hypothetical protein
VPDPEKTRRLGICGFSASPGKGAAHLLICAAPLLNDKEPARKDFPRKMAALCNNPAFNI